MTRKLFASVLLGCLALAPAVARPNDDDDEEEDSDGPEADTVSVFTIEGAIEAAVQYGPDFSRAKLDREAAQHAAGAARAEQQWQLRISTEYKRSAVSEQTIVPLFSAVDQSTLNAALALGRNLPTGGRVDVEVGAQRQFQEILIPEGGSFEALMAQGQQVDEFSTVLQTSARLTLKQPLVRGFGPDVALASQRRADLQFAISTIEAQQKAEEMMRDIVGSYWEMAFAIYEVDTRNRAVELAEQQEKVTRDELRAGKSPQSALNAVLYEVNVRKEALLKAQIEAEKKSFDLRRKIGLGLTKRNVILKPGEKFEIGSDEFDIDETLARSRKANRKMASVALQKKLAETELKVAKSGILPQVDLSVSGGLLGTGNETGTAITQLTQAGGYDINVGLNIVFDLSGAARSNYEASLAKRRRLDVDREDLERQIDAEVVNAVKAVTFARTRVALSDKAIGLADGNWKSEQQNFQAGRTSNYSVLQRQGELIEAQLGRGRAVIDYHISVATLQYLSGTILEQYGVNVKPKASRSRD